MVSLIARFLDEAFTGRREGLDHCKLTNECMGVAEVENPERLDGRTLS